MSYSAFAVANTFLRQGRAAHVVMTPARLQMLLYLAQLAHLKVKRSPLLDDFFVCANHGPSICGIHHKLRAYDGRALDRDIPTQSADSPNVVTIPVIPETDHESSSLVAALVWRYGRTAEAELLMLVAGPESAWLRGNRGQPLTLTELLADASRVYAEGVLSPLCA